MLFGYHPDGCAENSFHVALMSIVRSVHEAGDAQRPAPGWPSIVPQEYRERLKRREKLPKLIDDYDKAYRGLSDADRAAVREASQQQNLLRELLSATVDCKRLDELPEALRAPAQALFDHAFEVLSDLEERDEAYRKVYAHMPRKDCPFCGIEPMSPPGGRREDADHYLAKSIYAFAAANFENLPPMGQTCNAIKQHKNLLRAPDGRRRTAFYPFEQRAVDVVLGRSLAFRGPDRGPEWVIDFNPSPAEVETWDDVFDIRSRYTRELQQHFNLWVQVFGRRLRLDTAEEHPEHDVVVVALRRYVRELELDSLSGRDSLRLPVFRWLLSVCEAGNRRMSVFLARSAPPLRVGP